MEAPLVASQVESSGDKYVDRNVSLRSLSSARCSYSWLVVRGSCSATCGPTGISCGKTCIVVILNGFTTGVVPFLLLCQDATNDETVDEVMCNPDTKPSNPTVEPCNRRPCPGQYVIVRTSPTLPTPPRFFIDGKRMRGQTVPLRVKAIKLKYFIASRSSWIVQSNESATISATRPSRRTRFVRAEMTLAFVREMCAVSRASSCLTFSRLFLRRVQVGIASFYFTLFVLY